MQTYIKQYVYRVSNILINSHTCGKSTVTHYSTLLLKARERLNYAFQGNILCRLNFSNI